MKTLNEQELKEWLKQFNRTISTEEIQIEKVYIDRITYPLVINWVK